MRTLILLRHAKTESFNINGDKARELTERGRNDAANTGMALRADNVQHVLCSSSMRTRQTYDNLGLTMPDGSPVPVEYMDALYFGGTDEPAVANILSGIHQLARHRACADDSVAVGRVGLGLEGPRRRLDRLPLPHVVLLAFLDPDDVGRVGAG